MKIENGKKEDTGNTRTAKDGNSFISIEKKVAKRFGQVVSLCCIILGVITSVLSYISSISAVSETIDNTSAVAANYVAASLNQYVAIAYETGTIARLSDPERTPEEKSDILSVKVREHELNSAYLLDSSGKDILSGTDFSDRDYFKEAMKGNTYVSTPAYSQVTDQVSFAVAAPLWENGVAGSKAVGAIVYVPDGESLNNIMRSIKVGKGGTAFMTDSKGITIADINSETVGVEDCLALGDSNPKLKKFSAICQKMVNGEDGTGTYSYGGVTKIVSYSPVPDTAGWSIGVAAVRNEFLGKFYLALGLTVVFVIIFTLLGIQNGIRLGKAVAKPIITSVDRLKLLAAGDFHSDTPVPETNDETAILMNSLAETIHDLKAVVSDISSHLAELADGNFKITINEDYKGDFSLISTSFRDIISSLSAAMKEIDGNAESVQNGSNDLAGASQLLAEGATDQASAIEELTATITDISEKIHINAENAEKAKNTVESMNSRIMESNRQMQQNTEAMTKIKDASNKIAEIISSIEEIADQTNLLALNASIEAARAGEAGKGFAVVATQVGILAEQSSEAARNTNELIQNAISAVDDGTKLAKSAADSLISVVDNAKDVKEAIIVIAEASDNQAEAAAQVTLGITQIAEVVESNSATSEECAASSEELSGQADILKELVGRFQYFT